MTEVRTVVVSLFFWGYFLLSSALLWLVAVAIFLLTVTLDRQRRLLHLFSCLWAYHYVWLMPSWTATYEGRERIRAGKAYVLVANHQSLADIPVLFGLFRHFKWVSKREIFRVPFIGWNMFLNDYVRLARGKAASVAAMLRKCAQHLEHGSSILVFPEGTRSPDGEIHAFKPGAVAMAIKAGVEVIPIVIDGTRGALPKKSLLFRYREPIRIRVKVLEPVRPDVAGGAAELSRLLQERMRAELAAMRQAS